MTDEVCRGLSDAPVKLERKVLVNALTGEVGPGTYMDGFPTCRELALQERLPYTSTGSFAILTLPLL